MSASAQKDNIYVKQFENYKEKNEIDFDMLKFNLSEEPLVITIVIFRAESEPPNSTISDLRKKINSTCPMIRILSFELESTRGVNFGYFRVKSNGKVHDIKAIPPKLWITTSDPAHLSRIKSDLDLDSYEQDNSYLTKEYTKEDFYPQLNNIISNYCSLCDNKYIDFFLMNKGWLMDTLYNKVEKLESSLSNLQSKARSSFNFSTNIPLKVSLNLEPGHELEYNRTGGSFYNLDYQFYPNSVLGFGIELSFSDLSMSLTSSNNIVDTIKGTLDYNNDRYDRIIYAKNVTENFQTNLVSLAPQICLKICPDSSKKWSVVFSPKLRFSRLLKSEYNGNSGTVSYGALYEQYSTDTIFSGLYDYHQNVSIYSEQQTLAINSNPISVLIPIDLYYQASDKISFGFGGYYFTDLTNNLTLEKSNLKLISSSGNNYNSMLYRQKSLFFSSVGIRASISYKL